MSYKWKTNLALLSTIFGAIGLGDLCKPHGPGVYTLGASGSTSGGANEQIWWGSVIIYNESCEPIGGKALKYGEVLGSSVVDIQQSRRNITFQLPRASLQDFSVSCGSASYTNIECSTTPLVIGKINQVNLACQRAFSC
jgi:hypothetical protein